MAKVATDKVAWVTSVLRRHTPLMLSFAISGQSLEQIEQHNGLAVEFAYMRRSGIAFQFSQEEIAAARDSIHKQVAELELKFFEDFSQRCQASCEAFVETARGVGAKPLPEPHNGPAIEALLRPYFEAAVAQASFLLTLILVQFELEAFLESFVASRVSGDHHKAEVIAGLKVALEPTNEVRNLQALLELGRFAQSHVPSYREWIAADTAGLVVRIAIEQPAIWDRIQDYAKRYGWMGRMYFAGNPISAADVVLRLQNILRNDCAERLADVASRREAQLMARQRAIEALDDAQAEGLADVLGHYMHLRSDRLDAFFIAHEHVVDVLSAASRILGLRRADDILYLDWREITRALREGADARELQTKATARHDGFEFISVSGETEWIAPPTGTLGHTAAQASGAQKDLLTGVTASGGHVQGTARLILSDQDMLDMAPGEILVTTMTTPSLMLAVEKASGIVTDEGGMLCHAAIVSREFNIPCVIGTDDATKWIHTGDTIDLDADEGRVQVAARN